MHDIWLDKKGLNQTTKKPFADDYKSSGAAVFDRPAVVDVVKGAGPGWVLVDGYLFRFFLHRFGDGDFQQAVGEFSLDFIRFHGGR